MTSPSNTAWAREAAYKITRAYSRTLGAEAEPMIAQDITEALIAVERKAKEEQWQPTHRHYKGGLYRVIGEAVHTETSAFLTIYDNAQGHIFARPQGMFSETLPDGTPRFSTLPPTSKAE